MARFTLMAVVCALVFLVTKRLSAKAEGMAS